MACGFWLAATSLSQACRFTGSAADRKFEKEFEDFRYAVYQHFPDLGDSLLTMGGIMRRADSMCADFLKQHRPELESYFERKLVRLPRAGAPDTLRYELRDSLVWGDTVGLDQYFAQQRSLLKVMNCSPEWMAMSYRAMFLARSLDPGESGRYQLLNTLGTPKLSWRRLGPSRTALVVDTWRDIVVITLSGSRGNYKTVRFDRYVRRKGS
jgi:hypothetical protein